MNSACAPDGFHGQLVHAVLEMSDCVISDRVFQGYSALTSAGGGVSHALTAILVLYVAAFGFKLMLGFSSLSLGDGVVQFVKIGIVISLVTSWTTYKILIFDPIYHESFQLISNLTGNEAGGPEQSSDVFSDMQSTFDQISIAARKSWNSNPIKRSQPSEYQPSNDLSSMRVVNGISPETVRKEIDAGRMNSIILWSSATIFLISSLGAIIIFKVVSTILLIVGPIFIVLSIFSETGGLFLGWLRATLKCAFAPLLILLATAIEIASLEPFVSSLGSGDAALPEQSAVIGIAVVVTTFAVVVLIACGAASRIANGLGQQRTIQTSTLNQSVNNRSAAESAPTKLGQNANQNISAGGRFQPTSPAPAFSPPSVRGDARRITYIDNSPAGTPIVATHRRLGQSDRRLVFQMPNPRQDLQPLGSFK